MGSNRKFRFLLPVVAAGMVLCSLVAGLVAFEFCVSEPSRPAEYGLHFVDRHGHSLRQVLSGGDEVFRRRFALEDLSPHLVNATIAAEDKNFFQHHGIDFLATFRALRDGIFLANFSSGASTITQQLVKLRNPQPRTVVRKLQEMLLAVQLERELSKEEILEEYFLRLDYGNLCAGPASASWFYFQKPPSDLSAAQAALLAALPNAPTRLNPLRSPERALTRQRWILNRMLSLEMLSGEAWAAARNERVLPEKGFPVFRSPHFVDLLLRRRGVESMQEAGVVNTTLDLELNDWIEKCVEEELEKLHAKNAGHAAVVVLDNATSEVLALVCSGEYFAGEDAQVNAAWMPRSPGSALKPFTYLLALEGGANPGTILADIPSSFSTPTGIYTPRNYHRQFLGPVSLRAALGNSLNVPAVRTLQDLGGALPLWRLLIRFGIQTLGHPADHYGLGLTLGNAEVRLLELANAYATLARMGEYRELRFFSGNRAELPRRVCSDAAAWMVADILADNEARTRAFGANSALRFPFPVAVKTGTSSDYRDNWVFGFTKQFTLGVWVGNLDGAPMREITGVSGAGPIFHRIFLHLEERVPQTWFPPPASIQTGTVHSLTGKQVPPTHPLAKKEIFVHPPPMETSGDYDALGRVLLGAEYGPWLAAAGGAVRDFLALQEGPQSLQIKFPVPGLVCFYDPDLPASSQHLKLVASSDSGTLHWESRSLKILGNRAEILPGDHKIFARNILTGETAETWIRVKGL